MKFTLSWLKEHLETDATLDDIGRALTDLGLEVEGIVDPAAALGAFTIARVLEAEPHPDADRLRVCRVATGQGERQIICGAPNAREGLIGVVALPGTYVPGIDTTIGVGKIRGVESHGMLCSEREMQLSDEHDGIIDLPSGEVGARFDDWLRANRPERVDPVIDIAITPNRPDALGVRGVARDLAARGLGRLKPVDVAPVAGSFASPIAVSIDPGAEEACPHFTGRLIRGVTNGPSPDWLQARLRAVGLRSISALVDVTNFFTIDRARPLHVFDAGRLTGDLRIHAAAGGERLEALDDRTYVLEPGMTAISDDRGVQSLAGVVGGAATGCEADTTDVFLEAAWFEPVRTARTGRALNVQSDARYRFERGIDPMSTRPGLQAATRMILDLCGGEASEIVEAGSVPDHARQVPFDPARAGRILGMEVAADEQARILTALGFEVGDGAATVPSWRPDIGGPADLVEEVARVVSLTRLPSAPMARAHAGVPAAVLTPLQVREAAARRAAAAAGYAECVTYSFISGAAADAFGGAAARVANPISSEMDAMRPSLLPGLLSAARRNRARGEETLALFEIGPVFGGTAPEDQGLEIAGLLMGNVAPRDAFGSARPGDVFDVKAHLLAVLAAVKGPAVPGVAQTAPAPWWHPGRTGTLRVGREADIAVFGELHPATVAAFDLRGAIHAFTLALDRLPPARGRIARAPLAASDLPAVERDFAFVMDVDVAADAVVAAARSGAGPFAEEVRVFDVFDGPGAVAQLGEGRKSLAITVRWRPRETTLTEAEIAAQASALVEDVARRTGAVIRS